MLSFAIGRELTLESFNFGTQDVLPGLHDAPPCRVKLDLQFSIRRPEIEKRNLHSLWSCFLKWLKKRVMFLIIFRFIVAARDERQTKIPPSFRVLQPPPGPRIAVVRFF